MAESDGRRQSRERAERRELIHAVVDEILDDDGRNLLRIARLGEQRGLRRAAREIAGDTPVTALLVALGQRRDDHRRLCQPLGVRVHYAGDGLRDLLEPFSIAPGRARRSKTQFGVYEIGIEATPGGLIETKAVNRSGSQRIDEDVGAPQ